MQENNNEEINLNEENNNEQINLNEEVNIEGNVEETTEKQRTRILPIIVAFLFGIIVFAVVALLTISLMSPKNSFFRLIGGAFSNISNNVDDIQNSVIGQLLTIDLNSKLTLDMNVKGNIQTENQEIKDWFQNLETFEVVSKENMDIPNDYVDTTAKFILNGEDFLNGKLIQNKNNISVKVDNVTGEYITIDNDKLPELWQKVGYNGPESLAIISDTFKDIEFSKTDIKNLKNALNSFGNAFSSVFEDEDFSYGEGFVEYDEGTIECKSMDFVVDPVKFNDGLLAGLEELNSKEKYIDSLYKVSSTFDKVSGYEPLTREEFGSNFNIIIEEIRNLEIPEDAEGFIIRIYYKGNDILKVEMLSENYNTKIIEFTAVSGKDSGYYKLFDGMTIYEDKVTTIEDITTHEIAVNYVSYETGDIMEGYGNNISIVIDSTKDNEQTIKLTEKARLLSYDMDFETLDIMSIEPTIIRDYTVKASVDGDINNLEVILIDSDDEFSSTLSVLGQIRENAIFENIVPETSENFDVSTATDEEINNKKNKIIENWNTTIGKDNTKMQQFETAVSMYLSLFIPAGFYQDTAYDDVDMNSLLVE